MNRHEKMKVLIGTSSFAALDKTPFEELTRAGLDVVDNPFKRKLSKNEIITLLNGDIEGLIAGLEPLDREVLEKSNLKVISRCGSGMSNVDIDAAKELGIQVFSTPFGPTNAVAELTVGCLLSLIRHIPQMDRSMHHEKWDKKIGMELSGKKVAIIGFGRIGQLVATLLSVFGTEILAVDPIYPSHTNETSHMTLEKALETADIITLHANSTERIIGSSEFEMMKTGVFILNASRGHLIDEDALMNALDSGKVAGAWIDTFINEPYDGPLCTYPQVMLTPHIGSYTYECRRSMERAAAQNLIRGLRNDTHRL